MKSIAMLLSVFAMMVFLTSCGGKENKETESKDSTKTTEQTTQNLNPDQPFGVENGMLEYKMTTLGMESSIKMYWADFGKKTYTETVAIGMKSYILNDGKMVYSWNDMTKTGTKSKIDTKKAESINYRNLDDAALKQFNMKKEGTETIKGKVCDVYTMENAGAKVKTYIWNGLLMKSETVAMGMKTVMEVVELVEGAEAPAGAFELPKGINFTDQMQIPE